ncbi:MAG: nucleotide exchange factor GrpE, partial [Actinomycetota bacterium]
MKNTDAQQAGEREPDTAEAREAELAEEVEEADAAVDAEVEADEVVEEQAEVAAVTERADEDAADAEDATEAFDEVEASDDAIAADLEKARAEAESYLDDLRRLQADFDNYRKRTLREQTARAASASQALVARLLPVLDNFELAVSSAEHSRD